jgi:hypothetical protein
MIENENATKEASGLSSRSMNCSTAAGDQEPVFELGSQQPVFEIEYGAYRIKVWGDGTITDAPEGMKMRLNRFFFEMTDYNFRGYKRAIRALYAALESPATRRENPNPRVSVASLHSPS